MLFYDFTGYLSAVRWFTVCINSRQRKAYWDNLGENGKNSPCVDFIYLTLYMQSVLIELVVVPPWLTLSASSEGCVFKSQH